MTTNRDDWSSASDERLVALLRAARDAERLDLHASVEPTVLARLRRAAPLAAAAMVALAALAAAFLSRPASTAPAPLATTPTPAPRPALAFTLPPAGLESSATVLLAVAQDEHGRIQCVRFSDRALAPGEHLDDLTQDDLPALGLDVSCGPAARRVLLLGLTGPSAALPCSPESAEELARCVLASDACGHAFDQPLCTRLGSACAQPGLDVHVATLAMR